MKKNWCYTDRVQVLLWMSILFLAARCSNQVGHKSSSFISSIDIELIEIQRNQVPFKVKNISKGSGSWTWQVFNTDGDKLVLTSTNKNPTFKLPQGSYDILLTGTGRNTLTRHFRRIITVLPKVFKASEADEVIDLTLSDGKDLMKDYKGVVRPGYKIILKGSISGRVKITGLRGTKEKPVHIINSGQVRITAGLDYAPYPFLWSVGNQYIIMDGKADPAIEYGFEIKNHPSKSGQAFFIGGEYNRGFDVCGLHIIGRQGFAKGATAIQLQATSTDSCNASNWSFEYFRAHHNKIEAATNEGFYIGYFTDHSDKSPWRPYRLGTVLIYRNQIINSGRDGIQISSADVFEVHDNYVDGSGKDGNRNHNSGFSWNDGNYQGWCYRNTFINSAQGFAIFFGETGRDAYIYSNLLIQGTYPASAKAPCYIYAVADNASQPVTLNIFNNTINTKQGAFKVRYKNVSGKSIPINFIGNALSVGTVIPKYYSELDIGKNHTDSASWVIHNELRMDSLSRELWSENFKPVKASPLFKKNGSFLKMFPPVKGGYYDHDGYPYETDPSLTTYGCYSGYEFINKK